MDSEMEKVYTTMKMAIDMKENIKMVRRKEGKGIFYHQNGLKVDGEFIADTWVGKQIVYYNDKKVYEGKVDGEGNKHGKGILYYGNGDKYDGNWKKGKREGKGILYYANGDRYEGDFKDDLIEGKGIRFLTDGDKYEGDFKDGNMDGKGIYYYANGDWLEGVFKQNVTQSGTFHFSNGKSYDWNLLKSLRQKYSK